MAALVERCWELKCLMFVLEYGCGVSMTSSNSLFCSWLLPY